MAHWVLGIDVGGTKIEASLFLLDKDHFHIKVCQRVPTQRHLGYGHILQTLANLTQSVCHQASITPENLAALGLAVPGSVHPVEKRMINGNTQALIGKNILPDLRQSLSLSTCPMAIENDGNCFIYAEALWGVGLQHALHSPIGFGLVLGTGVGAGCCIAGKLFTGSRGGALEVGHITLVPNGLPCYCGQRGCAESYVSGTSLEKAYDTSAPCTAQEVLQLVDQGDPIAVQVYENFKNHLGFLLSQLTTLFDPHYFVLGGGLSNYDPLYETLTHCVEQQTFLPNTRVPIYKNKLGDAAGALGAGLLAFKETSFANGYF